MKLNLYLERTARDRLALLTDHFGHPSISECVAHLANNAELPGEVTETIVLTPEAAATLRARAQQKNLMLGELLAEVSLLLLDYVKRTEDGNG